MKAKRELERVHSKQAHPHETGLPKHDDQQQHEGSDPELELALRLGLQFFGDARVIANRFHPHDRWLRVAILLLVETLCLRIVINE